MLATFGKTLPRIRLSTKQNQISTCLLFLKQRRLYSTEKIVNDESNSEESLSLETEPKPIEYTVCDKDFHWVENVLPPSKIPYPPKHASYPTPSGWYVPSWDSEHYGKDYFIQRTKYHTLPITEERLVQENLNDWVTKIENVEGDINMFRKELVEFLKPYSDYDPAITVDEVNQTVLIRGAYLSIIEQYLYENKF